MDLRKNLELFKELIFVLKKLGYERLKDSEAISKYFEKLFGKL